MIIPKVVAVGDGNVGKTCLLTTFATGQFPHNDVINVVDSYDVNVTVDVEGTATVVQLSLWDTAGQMDYDRFRPLAYIDAGVVLLTFAIDDLDSFENVQEKWLPEVMYFCIKLPRILVGCKKDLRLDDDALDRLRQAGKELITSEQGVSLAQKIGAKRYFECSARTGKGLGQIFEFAARLGLKSEPNDINAIHKLNRTRCVIL